MLHVTRFAFWLWLWVKISHERGERSQEILQQEAAKNAKNRVRVVGKDKSA